MNKPVMFLPKRKINLQKKKVLGPGPWGACLLCLTALTHMNQVWRTSEWELLIPTIIQFKFIKRKLTPRYRSDVGKPLMYKINEWWIEGCNSRQQAIKWRLGLRLTNTCQLLVLPDRFPSDLFPFIRAASIQQMNSIPARSPGSRVHAYRGDSFFHILLEILPRNVSVLKRESDWFLFCTMEYVFFLLLVTMDTNESWNTCSLTSTSIPITHGLDFWLDFFPNPKCVESSWASQTAEFSLNHLSWTVWTVIEKKVSAEQQCSTCLIPGDLKCCIKLVKEELDRTKS